LGISDKLKHILHRLEEEIPKGPSIEGEELLLDHGGRVMLGLEEVVELVEADH
jgi:hypothetical protein